MFDIQTPVIIQNNIVQKAISDNTKQIATAFSTFKTGLKIARPTFPKEFLMNACKSSSVNMRCIATSSATVAGLGFTFEDEENADSSGVKNFIDNLIDRNGNAIPFSKLLTDWYSDYKMFGESYLEIARYQGQPKNLLLLSAKNCYTDLDRTIIAQIILTGDKVNQKALFRPYGESTATERDVLTLFRQSPFDDVYGVPVYTPCLTTIEANNKINAVNFEAMDNTINGSNMVVVTGMIDTPKMETITTAIRLMKSSKGKTGIVHLPDGATIRIEQIGTQEVDGNYIDQREKNELEIISIHGMTPDLFGTMQTGGISSGEKATGALKIYIQTCVRPEQEALSKMIDSFFTTEFPGYAGGFRLKEIDLTDGLEDQQAADYQARIQQTYITIGSLKLLNEYRTSQNLSEITKEEFAVMMASSINTAMPSPTGF